MLTNNLARVGGLGPFSCTFQGVSVEENETALLPGGEPENRSRDLALPNPYWKKTGARANYPDYLRDYCFQNLGFDFLSL